MYFFNYDLFLSGCLGTSNSW